MTNKSQRHTWAPSLLNLSDVAFELRLSVCTLRRLLSAGRLPPSDIRLPPGAKSRRWKGQAIVKFFSSHPT